MRAYRRTKRGRANLPSIGAWIRSDPLPRSALGHLSEQALGRQFQRDTGQMHRRATDERMQYPQLVSPLAVTVVAAAVEIDQHILFQVCQTPVVAECDAPVLGRKAGREYFDD